MLLLLKQAVREVLHESLKESPEFELRPRGSWREYYWRGARMLDHQNERLEFGVARLESVLAKFESWAPNECKFDGCENTCSYSREP